MKKFAIALLVSAGALISVQAHASDRAVIGAVDGALVGSYFGGAHGAVAGAIIGAAVGSSSDGYYYDDRRGRVRGERGYVRYEPAPVYCAPQASYEPYYEPRYEVQYEPRRVVYVQPSYPLVYASYRGPGYGYGHEGRYASSSRGQYAPTYNYRDHHRRY